MNIAKTEELDFINKALEKVIYDSEFKDSCRTLIKSQHNITSVKKDIDNYSSSERGKAYRHKLEAIKFCEQCKNPLVITLTTRYPLANADLEKRYTKFIHRISRTILKKRYTRYKNTVSNIAYIEGAKSTRAHIHVVIDLPIHIKISDYKTITENYWNKAGYIYLDEKMKVDKKQAAVGAYITKLRSKSLSVESSFIKV